MRVTRDHRICPRCGWAGLPCSSTPGSFFIEIVAWLAFIVPGLIYSLWRLSARHKACPECGESALVPITSPRGLQLIEKFSGPPRAVEDDPRYRDQPPRHQSG